MLNSNIIIFDIYNYKYINLKQIRLYTLYLQLGGIDYGKTIR